MTGMEHAIEHAARDEANRRHAAAERSLNKSKYGEGSDYHANDGARDGFVDGAEWAVEHLRAQGLIAPAPLTEERSIVIPNGRGFEFSHLTDFEQFAKENGGEERTRWVTAWEPVYRAEGDGRADQ